jgi:oxygen-dependent protoporphyrinogen oxidase
MKLTTGPIGNFKDTTLPIHIIGAGFTGLVMAYSLKKEGFNVTVYEKESIGGKLQSDQTSFGLVERAANAYYSSPELDELFLELNLKPINARPKLKKWIWLDSPRKPFNFLVIIKILFSLLKKIDIKTLDQASMYDFFYPLTGKQFAKDQLSAIFGGIYAIDSKTLSFKSVFKHKVTATTYLQFFRELRRDRNSNYKPRSISFKNGVHELVLRLKEELKENIKNEEITRILPESNWIICSDAKDAAKFFIDSRDTSIVNALNDIKYTSLSSSTIFTKKEVPDLKKSFGVVVPPSQNLKALGIVHNTGIFDYRSLSSDVYSYTFISKSESLSSEEVEKLLTLKEEDILYKTTENWKRAIPVYDTQRAKTILSLRQDFLDKENVILFGNYIDGISLREIFSHAKKISKDL